MRTFWIAAAAFVAAAAFAHAENKFLGPGAEGKFSHGFKAAPLSGNTGSKLLAGQ
jgi:hypothetical protein